VFTKTTVSAIRALISLGRRGTGEVVSPRVLAEELGESPTYLAKVCRLLVKAGILRAEYGAKGGVRLGRPKEEISLLSIVEACQGTIVGRHCYSRFEPESVCSFHEATVELHGAIVGILSRWNLARLLEKPYPTPKEADGLECVLMAPRRPGSQQR